MQAVILAGGLGTRLGSLTRKIPKPMVPVAGVPYLEHQLRLLARQSFRDVLLLTGYLGEQIESYFGGGGHLGLRLRYVREAQPQGTGGALRDARRSLAESFLLLYGDSLLPIEYGAAARRLKDSAALGLIVVYRDPAGETAVRPNVALDRSGLVTRYDKTAAADPDLEYVEAGVSCFRRDVLDLLPGAGAVSFEQCVFPRLIDRRQLAALPTAQRFYDIGTPERLRDIEEYLRAPWEREAVGEPFTALEGRNALKPRRTKVEYVALLHAPLSGERNLSSAGRRHLGYWTSRLCGFVQNCAPPKEVNKRTRAAIRAM